MESETLPNECFKIWTKQLSSTWKQYNGQNHYNTYANPEEAIKALKDIYQVSKTPQGRKKLHDFPGGLVDTLNTNLSMKFYLDSKAACLGLDHYHIQIYRNILKDQYFHESARYGQKYYLDKFSNHWSVNFSKGINQIIDMIKSFTEDKAKDQLDSFKDMLQNISDEQTARKSLKDLKHDFMNIMGFAYSKKDQWFETFVKFCSKITSYIPVKDILYLFPKSCPGCFLYSFIRWGSYYKKQHTAVHFLSKITHNRFDHQIYDTLEGYIISAYAKYNIQSSNDKRRLSNPNDHWVCLDLHYIEIYMELFNDLGKSIMENNFPQICGKEDIEALLKKKKINQDQSIQ